MIYDLILAAVTGGGLYKVIELTIQYFKNKKTSSDLNSSSIDNASKLLNAYSNTLEKLQQYWQGQLDNLESTNQDLLAQIESLTGELAKMKQAASYGEILNALESPLQALQSSLNEAKITNKTLMSSMNDLLDYLEKLENNFNINKDE